MILQGREIFLIAIGLCNCEVHHFKQLIIMS